MRCGSDVRDVDESFRVVRVRVGVAARVPSCDLAPTTTMF